jgi:hypothetical protein
MELHLFVGAPLVRPEGQAARHSRTSRVCMQKPQSISVHDQRQDALLTKFPGLSRSAASKWAWWLMYSRGPAGGLVDRTFDINPAQLAIWQGTDSRCGKDYLRLLAKNGLITLVATNGPIWKICLTDPLVAAIARRGPESHGQGEFFDREQPGKELTDEPVISLAARGAKEPPFASAVQLGNSAQDSQADAARISAGTSAHNSPTVPYTSEVLDLSNTSHFGTLRTFGKEGSIQRRSRDGDFSTQAPVDGATAIGDLLIAKMGQKTSPAERVREIERLVALIKKRVSDPDLRDNPCLTVAKAIVDGSYPVGALAEVFAQLEKHKRGGTLRAAPWCFFVGAVKKSMDRYDPNTK